MLDSSDVCYNNLIHNTVELCSIIKLRITSSPCANFLCFCRNNQLLYSNTEEPEYTEYSWVSAQLLTCFFFFYWYPFSWHNISQSSAIFHPYFTLVLPSPFVFSSSFSLSLATPPARLVQWSWSQRTLSSEYQSLKHFHWELLYTPGATAEKRTEGT